MKVFVSSPERDLVDHRNAVLHALRKAGIEYWAMEEQVADGSTPISICINALRTCDVYVGILANQYGTILHGHKYSATELEYREAKRLKKDIRFFLVDEKEFRPTGKLNVLRIQALRHEIEQNHWYSKFTTPDSLAAGVQSALHKLRTHIEIARRRFLKYVLGTAAVTSLSTIFYPKIFPLSESKKIWKSSGGFLEAFVSVDSWGIVPGDTNQHRLEKKELGRSPHVQAAFTQLDNACKQAMGRYQMCGVELNHTQINASKDANLLFIGGPVANRLTCELNEYHEIKLQGGKLLPSFNANGLLRWGFFCGTNGYGDWEGTTRVARRYDKGEHNESTDEQRPLYGLLDRKVIGPTEPVTDRHGYLQEDYLLITRRPHPMYPDKRVVGIGGMHGYVLSAFAQEIEVALQHIDAESAGLDCFQLKIPAKLQHDHAKRETVAQLLWHKIEQHSLSSRFQDWQAESTPS